MELEAPLGSSVARSVSWGVGVESWEEEEEAPNKLELEEPLGSSVARSVSWGVGVESWEEAPNKLELEEPLGSSVARSVSWGVGVESWEEAPNKLELEEPLGSSVARSVVLVSPSQAAKANSRARGIKAKRLIRRRKVGGWGGKIRGRTAEAENGPGPGLHGSG